MPSVPESPDSENGDTEIVTVSVSSNGQATIPKVFRDKLGIDAPGHVRFTETEEGDIVVERVPSVEEMQGFAARSGEASTDAPAIELLRTKREQDVAERADE